MDTNKDSSNSCKKHACGCSNGGTKQQQTTAFGKTVHGEVRPDLDKQCDLALQHIDNGEVEEAKAMTKELYKSHPEYHTINYLVGVCYIQDEAYADAIPFFEKAIAIYPPFTEAYYNLGTLYRQTGMLPQSITCYKKVIQLEGINSTIGQYAQKEIDVIANLIEG